MTRTPHRSAPTHLPTGQTPRLRARTRAAATLVALAGTGLLGACSYTSPPTAVHPYNAADGVNASAEVAGATLKLQNLLVVSGGKGQPGQLVGAISYSGSEAIGVQLTVAASARAEVTVRPGTLAQFGPEGTSLIVRSVPVAPGSRVDVEVATSDGAHQTVAVPVLPPTGYYASLSPSPEATDSESASPTGTDTASPSPTGSESPTATP